MEHKVKRYFDLLDFIQEKYPKNIALAHKNQGKWTTYTTEEFVEGANIIAAALLEKGFKKGDKIATVTSSCPQWNMLDMGMSKIGVVHVPLYPNQSEDDYEYLLNHCDAKLVILGNTVMYNRVKPVAEKIGDLDIWTIDKISSELCFADLYDLGLQRYAELKDEVQAIADSISPDDLLTLIYTSGTTGAAKGVMLSHRNLVSNFVNTISRIPIDHGDKALSFLPLCHIFERMVVNLYIYKGVSVYYAQSIGSVVKDAKELKIYGFTTVPRFLEKVYDQIIAKGKALTGIKKILFDAAVHFGIHYEPFKKGFFYNLKLKFFRKVIFTKWQDVFGGNVQMIVSGGAALQPRIARIFWAAGMPVQEGYGLSETSPVIGVNGFTEGEISIGTIGPAIKGAQIKIGEDGELLTKGDCVMSGYYKDPEYTKTVLSEDGWFHTGDIVKLVDDKFIKITDRKKSIFKLSSGKYIAPQVIENKLTQSEWIDQAMIVGEREKVVGALLVPSHEFVKGWAKNEQIEHLEIDELLQHPTVLKAIQSEISTLNKTLSAHEQIKKTNIIKDEWSAQSGELSLTLKLKRNVVEKNYKAELESMYGHPYKENK